YTMEYPEFALDQGKPNENIQDNKIFIGGRNFIYDFVYLDSAQVPQRVISYYTYSSKPPVDWKLIADPDLHLMVAEYEVDSIRLKVLNTDANGNRLAADQTLMVYEYFNQYGIIIPETELTGLIENSEKIFIHPPRNNGFSITEMSPFPELELPLEVGKTWSTTLSLPQEWSDITKVEFEGTANVYADYTIVGKETLASPFGKREVWKIEATGRSNKLGTSKSVFYFHEEIGFLRLHYFNVDDSQIVLNLQRVYRES
ncbi:MAG: hypothetical protein AAFO07_30570, partial [Bacteroidota bacterium]